MEGRATAAEGMQDVHALVGFEERLAGSEDERRAAVHLAERLKAMGREAEIEPVEVWPNYPLTHVIHALLGIAGSLVAVPLPTLGAVLAFVAAVSTFGDLTGSFYLVRRLTGRRASQNVVSPERSEKAGTLVLVAHYDTARTGSVFGPRVQERVAAVGKAIRRPVGAFEPFFWSLLVILLCTLVRAAGLESVFLTAIQFVPTVVLILSVPLLVDITLSRAVPGANDNASGVATVLRLAERHGGKLQHLDLWVLLTGAKESFAMGMRGWLKRHKAELDRQRTIFVNVDTVGHGTVRWGRREGFVLPTKAHPQLVELCREIAEDDEEDRFEARAVVSRSTSDGHLARARGFPALSISCLGPLDYAQNMHQPSDTADRVDPEALARAFGFCSELIDRLDRQTGPQLAERGVEEEEEG